MRRDRKDRDANSQGQNHRPYTKYPDVVKTNERLETYYNALLELPEEESKAFWDALKRELPNSFRFCGSKGHALAVKRLLQTRYIPEITKIAQHDGQPVTPPEPVPWYPDNLAWWMTTPKNVIRKFPPFASFQKFLVSETSVGNISRQEVVSMIPPLLMDLKPGMTALDLCAAPGSKAAQLVEMIHRGEEARLHKVMQSFTGEDTRVAKDDPEEEEAAKLEADPSDDGRATGLMIANDMDYKRSHMLIHQLKRLSSPNLIVTNHDATLFPQLRIPNPADPAKNAYLKFDRILADVPCSGDGTLRKNVNMWKDWSPGNALGLHTTQVRILVRALQLLKVGGRVVYSTCSMNPVENESVVAAAIERCCGQDKVEIVDCSDRLPLLKRADGMKKWKVMDKSGRMWNTWQEVEEYTKSTEDGVAPGRLVETMFPPTEGDCVDLPLERCMRVYSHMQDTGGFFITVLHKKAEFKAKPEAAAKQAVHTNGVKRPREDAAGEDQEAKRSKTEGGDVKGEPEVITSVTDTAMPDNEEETIKLEEEVKATLSAPVEEPKPEAAAEEIKTDAPAEDVKPAAPAADQAMPDADATPSTSTAQTPAASTPAATQPAPKRRPDGPFEEPFKYLSPDNDVIKDVTRFYGISPRFPTDRYMVRNAMGEPAKAIYYTSALVRDLLTLNEGRGGKFIHGGVKMFVKQDAPSAEVCRWRIQSEGMPILHGYVGEDRVVTLTDKETLRKLLVEMFPKISGDLWQGLGEIGERVRDIGMGCCVLRVEPDGSDPDFAERMALPLWKSFQSLNLMLPKEDRAAMLLRIFNDTTPLINITQVNGAKKSREEEGKTEKVEDAAKVEDGAEAVKVEEGAAEQQPEVAPAAVAE
ncbi:S-adenosyl-L-methionine-dependent methyltransferase [Coniochaeta ligniaria NRRL 30616]|uniref:S-adenosyl-L-methionine-dependent methyltransferase n=1 Tax=Coniochaeta ligniaria NRRL 30616 TaxID=1408157 RepID=A0A1J7IY78_9PEZI|nr:S-adenosyl-L-methionine-dependent methyltransferase [Coniochaeta ligniaria NRRL 30616]